MELKNINAARAATLREVGLILFKPDGLAMKHINHFIDGNGKSLPIDLDRLLSEDATVKERVQSKCTRRALGVRTIREETDYAVGSKFWNGIDPEITIFQYNFSNIEWWGALGSYSVEVEFEHAERVWKADKPINVKLVGRGVYRWAPDDGERTSQEVHKLADKLRIDKGASNFDMPSEKPILLQISRTTMPKISTLIQTNPQGGLKYGVDAFKKLTSY